MFFEKFDKKKYALILVTHGYAVQSILENYAAFNNQYTTEYCSITQIVYDDIKKDIDNPQIKLTCSDKHVKPYLRKFNKI